MNDRMVKKEDMPALKEPCAEIADDVVSRLRKAMIEQDVGLWLKTVYSEDDIVNEAQRRWFTAYCCEAVPEKIDLELYEVQNVEKCIIAKCSLTFSYKEFDTIEEMHVYRIEYISRVQQWCVVWFEKIPVPFRPELAIVNSFDFSTISSCNNEEWWENADLLMSSKEAEDPLSSAIYARSVPRNIRFREAHPMLECASLLSNMMSLQVAQLAAQVLGSNSEQLLANIYNSAKGCISVRLVREDRDNTWTSKFLAPWYGFDEMLALNLDKSDISGSCFSYMSFFYAVLRLGGLNENEILQVRSVNQDLIIVWLGSEPYLITSDKILKITPKTLYHRKEVTKIFTDCYFWTASGAANMHESRREYYRNLFEKDLSAFTFSLPDSSQHGGLTEYGLQLPNFTSISDPFELNHAVRKCIFENSRRYPDSPFTLAKYAYQTLYVPKPESYAVWSVQSPVVHGISQQYSSIDLFIETVNSFKTESIFLERDRIMTADQVIRHHKGDSKSKALLVYSYLNLKRYKNSFILYTTAGCYCILQQRSDLIQWDAGTGKFVNHPKGEILVAFDNSYSYYPLYREEKITGKEPEWLKVLLNMNIT